MYVVGKNIYFFGNSFDDQVLGKKAPDGVTETEGLVRAITVQPNRSMRSHNDHGIQKDHDQQLPCKIPGDEKIQEREHGGSHDPADQGYPVFPRFENIDSVE